MIPDLDQIVASACRQAGIPMRSAQLLRHYANAVYLVEATDEPVVARVAYREGVVARARTAAAIAAWLAREDFPVTVPVNLPSGAGQPVVVAGGDEVAVTFWRHYPQEGTRAPTVEDLAYVARRLHALAEPDCELPRYAPLRSFQLGVLNSQLGASEREWLLERIETLLADYRQLDFPLGEGLIHADMYLGNLLVDERGGRVVLGDWDSVCLGPREIDLAPTFTAARFGLDGREIDRFASAYGYDLRTWDGWATLREMREISTLSALIRLAPTDPRSASQLEHRLDTLRSDDRVALWQAR